MTFLFILLVDGTTALVVSASVSGRHAWLYYVPHQRQAIIIIISSNESCILNIKRYIYNAGNEPGPTIFSCSVSIFFFFWIFVGRILPLFLTIPSFNVSRTASFVFSCFISSRFSNMDIARYRDDDDDCIIYNSRSPSGWSKTVVYSIRATKNWKINLNNNDKSTTKYQCRQNKRDNEEATKKKQQKNSTAVLFLLTRNIGPREMDFCLTILTVFFSSKLKSNSYEHGLDVRVLGTAGLDHDAHYSFWHAHEYHFLC